MAETEITEQLTYIVASVNRQLEEELQERLRPSGVPIEWLRILDALDRIGACPMGELATYALVGPPTFTKIIDRMVSEFLVFRAPDPGRPAPGVDPSRAGRQGAPQTAAQRLDRTGAAPRKASFASQGQGTAKSAQGAYVRGQKSV